MENISKTKLYYTLKKASNLSCETFDAILLDSSAYYNRYSITKKSGGKRQIAAPAAELKIIQKAVARICVSRFPVSRFNAAYERGCSVKDNALLHRRAKRILHMDIKDFFPSIGYDKFSALLAKKYDKADIDILWAICSLDGSLPIGACTSPFIANRIMLNTDKKLNAIKLFVKYSRYADDLVFSSRKEIPKQYVTSVRDILKGAGFVVNDKKTVFMAHRREVNGLIIKNDSNQLSTGLAFKKKLKNDIYLLLTKNIGDRKKILGRLSYLNDIEPDYAEAIRRKYLSYDKVDFFTKKA